MIFLLSFFHTFHNLCVHRMKTLKDPYFDRDLRPHSITLTDADLKRLDRIMEKGNLKNRSAAIRACIQFTYYQNDLNIDG